MNLKHVARTHVGKKRTENQDRYLVQAEDSLFVVCDGMGGHFGGETAAQTAVDTLAQFFAQTRDQQDITWPYKGNNKLAPHENRLAVGIKWANFQVFDKSQTTPKLKGMGTTCVSILVNENQCVIAHVGDSRCYRLRGNKLEPMTQDHSLLNDYIKVAKLTEEEIRNFPHKNVIVRALGMKEHVAVDTRIEPLRPNDIFLLCCDGLTGEIEDSEIESILVENAADLDKAADILLQTALDHGGRDNITLILVQAA